MPEYLMFRLRTEDATLVWVSLRDVGAGLCGGVLRRS